MKSLQMKKSSGAVSRALILVTAIVIVIIVVVFVVLRFASVKNKKPTTPPGPPEPPKPVYETQVGDVKFSFLSSEDMGSVLKSSVQYQNDLVTTERFVKVVVGAQNKGKNNTSQYTWDLGNIVDSEGRNYTTINDKAYNFLPKPDLCGAVLKPEFDPTPCIKYYEVSKEAKGMKIIVSVSQPKKQTGMIDLYFGEGE